MSPLIKKLQQKFNAQLRPKSLEESSCSPIAAVDDDTEGLINLREFSRSRGKPRVEQVIVAIHGLNGDPRKTWSKDGSIWFADFVPQMMPEYDFCISTFGYSSKVAFCSSTFRIRDYATQLLTQLHWKRKHSDSKDVPIIFICHSLGGIVFKKAITIAHEQYRTYSAVSNSIAGVMFMGTPHWGSGVANWMMILGNLANLVTLGSVRTELLKGLETKSEELEELTAQFVPRTTAFQIVSVYEGRPLISKTPIIVSRNSALLALANEIAVPIDADHREICRFSDPKSPRYIPVMYSIMDMIGDVLPSPDSLIQQTNIRQCLQSLHFDDYMQRRLLVTEPFQGTMSWIWTHPEYIAWEESPCSDFVWLQGKPGSGKSTLANYVRSGLGDRVAGLNGVHHVIVDFFYSARGGDHQRAHTWMLRSILYQIIQQAPGLWPDYKFGFNEYNLDGWTLGALQHTFQSLGQKYKRRLPLVIFIIIDAMDESEEEKRQEIIQMLHNSVTATTNRLVVLKVFVASRPHAKIGHALQACRSIIVQNETLDDIKHYVRSEMGRLAEKVLHVDPLHLNPVAEQLIDRANGVILWVKLVICELEEHAIEGMSSPAEMGELLSSIPSELEDLYTRIALKLDSRDRASTKECQTLLRWVTFSPRPLSLTQVIEIIAVSSCDCGEPKMTLEHLKQHRVGSAQDMGRRIITRCGNLLETKNGVVQFIHQTAREYVLSKMTAENLYVAMAAASKEMSATGGRYLDIFTHYFTESWIGHGLLDPLQVIKQFQSLSAEESFLLRFFSDDIAVRLDPQSAFGVPIIDAWPPGMSASFRQSLDSWMEILDLAVFAAVSLNDEEALDLATYSPFQVHRLHDVYTSEGRVGFHQFEPADESGIDHRWSLLQIVAYQNSRDLFARLIRKGFRLNFSDDNGQTVLFQAAEVGNQTVFDVNPVIPDFCHPSEREKCRRLDGNTVKDPFSLNPMVLDDDGGTPLSTALSMVWDYEGDLSPPAAFAWYDWARRYLEWSKPERNLTEFQLCVLAPAMRQACVNGDSRAFKLLAPRLKIWDELDDRGRSLLHISAEGGHDELVSLLISLGRADRTLRDDDGRTALDLAVLHDHSEVVELLSDPDIRQQNAPTLLNRIQAVFQIWS